MYPPNHHSTYSPNDNLANTLTELSALNRNSLKFVKKKGAISVPYSESSIGKVLAKAEVDFSEDIPSDSEVVGALIRGIGYNDRVYAVIDYATSSKITCNIIGRMSTVNAFNDYVYVTLLYV